MLPPSQERRRRAITTLAAAVVCCAATACGASDGDQVKSTVKSYIQAVLDADGKAACGLLTSDAANAFVSKVAPLLNTHDCATAFHKEASMLTTDEKAVYRSAVLSGVSVTGDNALASVKFTGVSKDIALKKVNGDWRIATGPVG